MNGPESLKLMALDEEDLAVISTHAQDSVLKIGDLTYLPKEKRFLLAMNRFDWEGAAETAGRQCQRRRTVLHFDRVLSVKAHQIDRDAPETVLELLCVAFEPSKAPADAPAGAVVLTFAGGSAVRLEVECIEARLADIGAAWQTAKMPHHPLDDEAAASGRDPR